MIKLLNEKNKVTAESILALLKDNQIEGYIKKPDFGGYGYTHINSGHSIYGYDIYIDESDLEKAKEIVEFLQSPPDEEGEMSEEDIEFEEAVRKMEAQRYIGPRIYGNIYGKIFLLLIAIAVIVGVGFSYFG